MRPLQARARSGPLRPRAATRLDPITALVDRTSRTFALGIRQLPRPLERVVGVAYLTLRVSDYFEDNERMPPDEKVRYLEAWADALAARLPSVGSSSPPAFAGPDDYDDTTSDALAARAAPLVLDAYAALPEAQREIVGRHVVDSTRGMARWVRAGPAFRTEGDLDDYMFEVAGRVGLLLTDLFAQRSAAVALRHEEMTRLGVEFGLGLQTVNVIRGLSSDPDRGWVFVPRAFVPPGVDDPASLWRDPDGASARALLDVLVDKASRHLDAARSYVLGIPRREYGIRVFCVLPLLFARRTVELSRANPRVFSEEVKLTRAEVVAIARRTRLLAASNAWVASAAR